jgi:hypothetical protein
MLRSHYLMVPISGQGIIVDPGTKPVLQAAMVRPFEYTDIFLYSHGWWTRAEAAMIDYNRFLMGFARVGLEAEVQAGSAVKAILGLGLHWPSMVSEDANTPLTVLQPFTYFNRAKMADIVGENGGYALLRIALEARRAAGIDPPAIHLTGHSFGCKVVCAALQALANDFAGSGLLDQLVVDVALLQAAFDHDELEPNGAYGRLLASYPKLRILLTTSKKDLALVNEYQAVQKLMHLFKAPTPALGATGPTAATIAAAGGADQISVGPGFMPSTLTGRLIVADLTPLHQANPSHAESFSGQHSDIYYDEIYRLMAAFHL